MIKNTITLIVIYIIALYYNFYTILADGYEKMNILNFLGTFALIFGLMFYVREYTLWKKNRIFKVLFVLGIVSGGIAWGGIYFGTSFSFIGISGILNGVFIVPMMGIGMLLHLSKEWIFLCAGLIYALLLLQCFTANIEVADDLQEEIK